MFNYWRNWSLRHKIVYFSMFLLFFVFILYNLTIYLFSLRMNYKDIFLEEGEEHCENIMIVCGDLFYGEIARDFAYGNISDIAHRQKLVSASSQLDPKYSYTLFLQTICDEREDLSVRKNAMKYFSYFSNNGIFPYSKSEYDFLLKNYFPKGGEDIVEWCPVKKMKIIALFECWNL